MWVSALSGIPMPEPLPQRFGSAAWPIKSRAHKPSPMYGSVTPMRVKEISIEF
jgi:hypothetical protein